MLEFQDTPNTEFIRLLDEVPLGNLQEHSDSERYAKIVLLASHIHHSKHTSEEDYLSIIIVGSTYLRGLNGIKSSNKSTKSNKSDPICTCQAMKILNIESEDTESSDNTTQPLILTDAQKSAFVSIIDVLTEGLNWFNEGLAVLAKTQGKVGLQS